MLPNTFLIEIIIENIEEYVNISSTISHNSFILLSYILGFQNAYDCVELGILKLISIIFISLKYMQVLMQHFRTYTIFTE